MGWFSRTSSSSPSAPSSGPNLPPWSGGSWTTVHGWLEARVPLLDGHADEKRRRRQHLLTLSVRGRPELWVQAAGDPTGVTLQAQGARTFGGEADITPAAEQAILAEGWQAPRPYAEWQFYTAEVVFDGTPAPIAQVVRLLVTMLRDGYAVSPGDIVIEDTAYPG